jgi:hypothetical protein
MHHHLSKAIGCTLLRDSWHCTGMEEETWDCSGSIAGWSTAKVASIQQVQEVQANWNSWPILPKNSDCNEVRATVVKLMYVPYLHWKLLDPSTKKASRDARSVQTLVQTLNPVSALSLSVLSAVTCCCQLVAPPWP